MIGQWAGFSQGTNNGFVTINLEHEISPKVFAGRVMFTDFSESGQSFFCAIHVTRTENQLKGVLYDFCIFDYGTNILFTRIEFLKRNKDANVPTKADLVGIMEQGNIIKCVWKTEIGTKGTVTAQKSKSEGRSEPDYVMETWDDFKKLLSQGNMNTPNTIYRGHTDSKYKLRTTFHRCKRSDLIRYNREDLIVLAHHINSASKYKYELTKNDEYYALLSLGQHHGYPTPLLDWTESPYVSAYFAYNNIETSNRDGYVRIFIFQDTLEWERRCPALKGMLDPKPSITIRVFPALNNRRAIPQQSIFMLSNVDDMENFISLIENICKRKFLLKIDLPASQRKLVMQDLQKMGITAASLFPGFDGICSYLKERYF